MYSPLISDDLIQKLYRLKKATRTPMTELVDAILRDALDGVDAELYGTDKLAAYRLMVRDGKPVPWLPAKKEVARDPAP